MKTKQQPRHTITIEKDGRVRTSDRVGTGANAFFDEHVIGTIGVDVEIVDERDTFERWVDPVQQERARIIEEVEKMQKESEKFVPFQKIHYQSALNDIINIIKNKL
jgi:hypothetical protein